MNKNIAHNGLSGSGTTRLAGRGEAQCRSSVKLLGRPPRPPASRQEMQRRQAEARVTELFQRLQTDARIIPDNRWVPEALTLENHRPGERPAGSPPVTEGRWVQKTRSMEVAAAGNGEGALPATGPTPMIQTTETQIMIPYRTQEGDQGFFSLSVSLAKVDINQLARATETESRQHIRQVMTQADLPEEWVATLTRPGAGAGGSNPAWEALVQQLVASQLAEAAPGDGWQGYECTEGQMDRRLPGGEAVLLGADILTAMLAAPGVNPSGGCLLAHDVGIMDAAGRFIPVLTKGSAYPVRASRLFAPARDHQGAIAICVARQPGTAEGKATGLGTIALPPGDVEHQGPPMIEVTFVMEADGMLTVRAMDLASGACGSLKIPGSHRDDEARPQVGEASAEPGGDHLRECPPVWGKPEGESVCPSLMRNSRV